MMASIRNWLRWRLMPGLNLFTRRRVRLARYWKTGPRKVLDAGSGNGWFSYLAYQSGANVTAVNFAEDQVKKAKAFYNDWKGIPTRDLNFEQMNLYDIDCFDAESFDEIICFETLEHIKHDEKVCRSFHRLLKPGGVLHLCCPNADHPRWKNEWIDTEEKGYHVRAGYTLASYRALLEPLRLRVVKSEMVGGPLLTAVQQRFEQLRGRVGDLLVAPIFFMAIPIVLIDGSTAPCPYCVYVQAAKE